MTAENWQVAQNIQRARQLIKEAEKTIRTWEGFIAREQAKLDPAQPCPDPEPVLSGFDDNRESLAGLLARLRRRASQERSTRNNRGPL